MPNLPERKVGIVACSGEEIAEGTVTRLAALKVLHETHPGKTVTICLPLFLAGGEGDRAFARFHPTITVDGCELRCAAKGTEMYSGKPSASVVVSDLAAEHRIGAIEGRRSLNQAGKKAVELTAERVGALVEELLGKPVASAPLVSIKTADPAASGTAGCSCGSAVRTQTISIDGRSIEILALPLIFSNLRDRGRTPETAAEELMESVAIYNHIPPEAATAYREVLVREYARFWSGGSR
ncbi:MAG TPA: putative zinc-binding protein [Terriglobales bacterium]|nr:putative zinc-binding protein [Terriglobales bacterium]